MGVGGEKNRQTVSVRKIGGSNINVQDDTQPVANGRQCLGVCMGVGGGEDRQTVSVRKIGGGGGESNINVQTTPSQ